jgi:hypothetical protein
MRPWPIGEQRPGTPAVLPCVRTARHCASHAGGSAPHLGLSSRIAVEDRWVVAIPHVVIQGLRHHCGRVCRRDGMTTQRQTCSLDKPGRLPVKLPDNALTGTGPDRTLTYCD